MMGPEGEFTAQDLRRSAVQAGGTFPLLPVHGCPAGHKLLQGKVHGGIGGPDEVPAFSCDQLAGQPLLIPAFRQGCRGREGRNREGLKGIGSDGMDQSGTIDKTESVMDHEGPCDQAFHPTAPLKGKVPCE